MNITRHRFLNTLEMSRQKGNQQWGHILLSSASEQLEPLYVQPQQRNTLQYLRVSICSQPKELAIRTGQLLRMCMTLCSERDMAQWLEPGALPMSLPAVRFRIPLGAEFSEKYHVSPLSILGRC